MNDDSFNEKNDLTESERAAFAALPREAPASRALEERVVSVLKEGGVLRDRRSTASRFALPVGALAAAGVLFAAGLAAGRRASAPAPARVDADARPEFVLFLQEGKDFDRGNGAGDTHVAEYKAWAQGLGKQGLLVAGEKLTDEGLLLKRTEKEISIEKEKLDVDNDAAARGFFIVRARDLDQALAIAKDCPHVKHGGRISLRPIEKV